MHHSLWSEATPEVKTLQLELDAAYNIIVYKKEVGGPLIRSRTCPQIAVEDLGYMIDN